jgi:hypothetical protein
MPYHDAPSGETDAPRTPPSCPPLTSEGFRPKAPRLPPARGHGSSPLHASSTTPPPEEARHIALGKKNREPRTEPKEPGTGTERTGTEKVGSYSVPDSWEPNYPGSFGSVLGYPKNRGNITCTHIA